MAVELKRAGEAATKEATKEVKKEAAKEADEAKEVKEINEVNKENEEKKANETKEVKKAAAGSSEAGAGEAALPKDELARVKAAFAARLKELEVLHEADRLLQEAGAKNLTAARALLDLAELLAPGELPKGWQERLREQVGALQEGLDTAFLFAKIPGGMQGWVGLKPAAGDDEEQESEGDFRLRLAQAQGVQESIRIKQEAAASGVFL